MNRRNFLKTVGVASIASLIPFNLKADDKDIDNSVDVRTIYTVCLDYLSDPMDCSPPGSSIHGIFQTRVLEWGAIAFSEVQKQ